ncbi:5-nitrosalicylic acid 1,2-dioxygenase [bacterium HR10]|nr:5-nitrosalicylic acid 1,2-dioxygenase [bacterium HR10]
MTEARKFITYLDAMTPPSRIQPMKWTREEIYAELERLRQHPKKDPRAGTIVSLYNPSTGNLLGTTPSILAGFQWIEPGEHGQAHKHTFAGIYYVVRGRGYTIVDGKKIEWKEGDVLALPPWSFHENVNADPAEPAILLGVFDLPLMMGLRILLEEELKEGYQPVVEVVP